VLWFKYGSINLNSAKHPALQNKNLIKYFLASLNIIYTFEKYTKFFNKIQEKNNFTFFVDILG